MPTYNKPGGENRFVLSQSMSAINGLHFGSFQEETRDVGRESQRVADR